ncbi:thioredoxin-related protein [Roseovarius sp. MBR-51]
MHTLVAFLVSLSLTVGLIGPLSAAELVMVERHGCHWCEQWNAEIGPIYSKTVEGARAPLRRVQIKDLPANVEFVSPPVFTPTFVLVDEGRELGRIEGYAGDEFFWFILTNLLDAHPDATALP